MTSFGPRSFTTFPNAVISGLLGVIQCRKLGSCDLFHTSPGLTVIDILCFPFEEGRAIISCLHKLVFGHKLDKLKELKIRMDLDYWRSGEGLELLLELKEKNVSIMCDDNVLL